MENKMYNKSVRLQKFLNFTEFIAELALHTRLPKNSIIEKTVAYSNEGKSEVCDLIYNKDKFNSGEKMPVMIYIHGGGWISGLKNMRKYYCYNFSEKGFFVANIHYDYAPQKQHPYQLQQILKAIDFIFDNADKYNLDTSKILLAGESAGGYFVAETSVFSYNKDLLDRIGLKFKHRDEFSVSANIINCGAFDIVSLVDNEFPNMRLMIESYTNLTASIIREGAETEKIKLLSPSSFINEKFPPTFIIYAAKDKLQTESFKMDELLTKFNVPHAMYKGEGIISMHAFPLATNTKRGKDCYNKTLDFIMPYINK